MSVAVLFVNYRAYDDLDRSLASVSRYVRDGDEIVVVDYESDPDRARQISSRYPRARMLARGDNLGFAAGVNLAAAATNARFLLLLNPDTTLEGPVLAVLESWLLSNEQAGVAGPRVYNTDGTVQPSARRFPDATTLFGGRSTWLTRRLPGNWFSRRNLVGRDATAPLEVDWVSGACLLTRRDLFDRLGGLDEGFFMYWEDADYCRRASRLGFRCAYVPTVEVHHSGGMSARHNVSLAIRAFHRSAFRLYRKNASSAGLVLAPLVWIGLRLRAELRVWQARRAGATVPARSPERHAPRRTSR